MAAHTRTVAHHLHYWLKLEYRRLQKSAGQVSTDRQQAARQSARAIAWCEAPISLLNVEHAHTSFKYIGNLAKGTVYSSPALHPEM